MSKLCIHDSLWCKSTVLDGFPSQKVSNAEIVSVSWYHAILHWHVKGYRQLSNDMSPVVQQNYEPQHVVKLRNIWWTFWSRWRHQMETFSALLALCAGNSPVTGEFPAQGQWSGVLIFSLICAWINGKVNNHEAGDFRRHRAHYDVIHSNEHSRS